MFENCSISTIHLRWIKGMASEVFKSLKNLNPKFINEIFQNKDISYDLRDSSISFQPKFSKITHGKTTLKYYGTHIWSWLPNCIKESTTINNFKFILKASE